MDFIIEALGFALAMILTGLTISWMMKRNSKTNDVNSGYNSKQFRFSRNFRLISKVSCVTGFIVGIGMASVGIAQLLEVDLDIIGAKQFVNFEQYAIVFTLSAFFFFIGFYFVHLMNFEAGWDDKGYYEKYIFRKLRHVPWGRMKKFYISGLTGDLVIIDTQNKKYSFSFMMEGSEQFIEAMRLKRPDLRLDEDKLQKLSNQFKV